MIQIAFNCPHCCTKKVGQKILQFQVNPNKQEYCDLFCICPICFNTSIARVSSYARAYFEQSVIDSQLAMDLKSKDIQISAIIPSEENRELPENLPEKVRASLTEAENCFKNGAFSASGAMYRKCIERATRALGCNVELNLYKRIDSLSEQLPTSLIEALHQVRLFGNTSVHGDDDDPEKSDVETARDFTFLFLEYCFALPKQIENAKSKHIKKSPPSSHKVSTA